MIWYPWGYQLNPLDTGTIKGRPLFDKNPPFGVSVKRDCVEATAYKDVVVHTKVTTAIQGLWNRHKFRIQTCYIDDINVPTMCIIGYLCLNLFSVPFYGIPKSTYFLYDVARGIIMHAIVVALMPSCLALLHRYLQILHLGFYTYGTTFFNILNTCMHKCDHASIIQPYAAKV